MPATAPSASILIDLPVALVILVCAAVIVWCVWERLSTFKRTRVDSRSFMKELSTVLRAGKTTVALDYCRANDGTLSRIIRGAIRTADRPVDEQRYCLAAAVAAERVVMERNLVVLATMSRITPLVGVAGSLVGAMYVLRGTGATGGGAGPEVVTALARCLPATVAGVVLAIAATIFYNFFLRVIRRRVNQFETACEGWFTLRASVARTKRPSSSAAKATAPIAAQPTPAAPRDTHESLPSGLLG